MRKGKNVIRNEKIKLSMCSHRVIIPLYIPNEEGYYTDAFRIFELCLFSIRKTALSPIKISVISNGSNDSVNIKLMNLQNENHIDELIVEKENIGKINSILKALRTAEERLITITDADVLFLNNWEKEIIIAFESFPKAGMISPVPMYRTQLRLTSNIWKRYLFSKRLKFSPVKNPEALTRFAKSISWPGLSEKLKDVVATLKAKNDVLAVIGNSHFVGTYKREVFNKLPKFNSKFKLGGNSESLYLDKPVLKYGGYRLATYDNYAYHLGNSLEPWMEEEFTRLNDENKVYNDFKQLKLLKKNTINYFLSEKMFKKLFYSKHFKKYIYRMKGLNKEQIYNYLDNDYN